MNQTRYTKSHEWIRRDSESVYTVGITDFAQQEIRDIVFIELPKVGQQIKQGTAVASIESVKAAFEIYAPVSGKIVAVNEKAAQDVSLVHRSAETEGWLFKIEASDPRELDNLMDLEAYKNHTATAAH